MVARNLSPTEAASKVTFALALAERGRRVHPLHHIRTDGACSCGKRTCSGSAGKHPMLVGWQQLATTDEEQIAEWWRAHPDANIGIATGEGSECAVIDADGPEGRASLEALASAHGGLPETFTVETGGGGLHLYFQHPEAEGVVIANTVSRLAPKVDVRTERGNLVGPGSVHRSGRAYRIAADAPLAPMPEWLVARLAALEVPEADSEVRPVLRLVHDDTVPERTREEWASAYARRIDPAIEGSGGDKHTFITATKIVRGFDLPEGGAFRVLSDWNRTCQPPWTEKDLRRKIREAATKGRMPWGQLVGERTGRAEQRRREHRPSRPTGAAEPEEETMAEERPTIRLGVDLHRMVDEAVEALGSDEGVFQRGGTLVQVVRDAAPPDKVRRALGAASIAPLAVATLREKLTSVARWSRFDRRSDEWVLTMPPDSLVQAVAARGQWPAVRPLAGILETPALRPDGTVIQAPGYDAATGYLFLPSLEFPAIPDRPTHAEAVVARDELLEVVRDFPFAGESHRAAWLALLLTLFARPAIDGCVPLAAIDATTRGTGKGRLVDATAILATGREATKTPMAENDEECRKRITSLVIEGERLACIDNVAAPIAFPSLDAVLTSTTWKDRVLGRNATVTAPNLIVWTATGNNLAFGADTARRTLHIRLESPLENPEDRADFAHPDLIGWVKSERPRLVRAALTLLRAYFVAGCPEVDVKAWGSFEAWSRVVASAVVWAGMPDPQGTRLELEATADTTKNALVALLDGWARLAPEGLTAKGALAALYPADRLRGEVAPDGYDDLRDAIESLCPALPGKAPSPVKLGQQLRQFRRRVVGGRMVDSRNDRKGIARWRVAGAGDAGNAGAVPNPSRESVSSLLGTGGENIPVIPGITGSAGGGK